MTQILFDVRKPREQSDRSDPRTITVSLPADVGRKLRARLCVGQRSGFVWRAIVLLLALLSGEKGDMQTAFDAIAPALPVDRLKPFGTALVEMSRYFFEEKYGRTPSDRT